MTALRITLCLNGTAPEPWQQGLSAALPEAVVSIWQPGMPQPAQADLADLAVVWAPPQAFIDEQTSLKALFNIGAGVDALLRLRLPPDLAVVRLDDAGMAVQMAEYVCQAVIRHFRELDVSEAEMAAGQWAFRKPRQRADFAVGVLGLGVLGTRVAQALRMFEFPVNGWSRTAKSSQPVTPPVTQSGTGPLDGVRFFAGDAQLPEFLAASRVLVNLLPLTAQTENILNRSTLSQLQPGGYVINVARGAHLVEADLLALLDSGHLAGATLDVFRTEPLPEGHPFWHHPRLTLTPHTSARTLRDDSIAQIASKIRALAAGQPVSSLAGVVDHGLGY
jgi:glyoxylate/hydroxypyruvate reductase A